MTIKEFRDIALNAAKGQAPANFSVSQVNKAFTDGLNELAGTYNQFMKNRYDIYDVIIEAADEVMPNKVISAIGIFAEVKQVGQNEKATFKRPKGRGRARMFLTQVGLSGVYETFRLDKETFDVTAHAVGGGATVDFERMLDGEESLAEVMDVLTEGLTDAVFNEVQKALRAAADNNDLIEKNKYSANTFNATEMVKLMNIVRAYGDIIIFAPPEFIAAMGPDAIVPVSTGTGQGVYSPEDIEAIHRTGFINIFRGAPIVQIPQSFVDENNEKTWIDPQIAYILPSTKDKIVKVVLEGQTQIRDHENKDNSMEIYAWKKMGCAIACNHNWALYQNTGITQTYENPYGV